MSHVSRDPRRSGQSPILGVCGACRAVREIVPPERLPARAQDVSAAILNAANAPCPRCEAVGRLTVNQAAETRAAFEAGVGVAAPQDEPGVS